MYFTWLTKFLTRQTAYNPSKVAAGIFAGLYGITTFVLFFRLSVNRTWWGLCLPIGAACASRPFLGVVLTCGMFQS